MIYYLDDFVEELEGMKYSPTTKVTINGCNIDRIIFGDYNNVDIICCDAKTELAYEIKIKELEDEADEIQVDLNLAREENQELRDEIEDLKDQIKELKRIKNYD